ncbi:MAG: Lrp/AsnC family transcriptional regulator [Armatimonadota bacterium]|nr:Lrp/AsnC family transcriptional regulator [Armatimonadota bacterium]
MRRHTMPLQLDALDWKLIAVLQENACLTNKEIAARVGSSEPTVRRRVKRLLASGLVRIVAVVTPFDLGYRVVALLGILVDQSRLPEIAEALAAIPEVRFAGVTSGSYDIVAEVWFQNTEDLVEFISGRLRAIQGLQRVETIQVLKLIRYAYDWGAQPSAALLPAPGANTSRPRLAPSP